MTYNKDTHERVDHTLNMALAILTEYLISRYTQPSLSEISTALKTCKPQVNKVILDYFLTTRSQIFVDQNTSDSLWKTFGDIYTFVRKTLGVLFHKGLDDHLTPRELVSIDSARRQTIGFWIDVIYESL